MRSGITSFFFVSVVGLLAFASVALANSPQGTVYNLSPTDNWFDTISCDGCAASDLLQPGDEVVLAPGTYTDSRRINIFARGTAEHPITIRAADPNNKPIFQRPVELDPFNSQLHVLNIEGAQYLTIRGVEVVGGAWGVRIGGTQRPSDATLPIHARLVDPGPLAPAKAKFITFENNVIRDTGLSGITANMDTDEYEGIIIRNNEITRLGQGDAGIYVGCNNIGGATSCVFRDGLIEGNYIHDIDNGNGTGVGDGIQIKDGSYNNIVRDNVIHNTGGDGAVGILVYGTDGNAPNIIERNVIWNAGDNAIQAASEAIIRNNIIFSAEGDGIRSQNHQSAVVGNLTIVNNTVFSINGRDVLDINSSGSLSGPIVVANNAFYATGGGRAIRVPSSGDVTVVGNVGVGSDSPSSLSLDPSAWDPTGDLFTDFGSFASMDAFPIVGSNLIGAGDASFQPDADFNGVSRSGSADVGAYVFNAAGNPGWQIIEGFKTLPLPGDYDSDSDVDGADFLAWQRGLGSTYDADDLADWGANFGTVAAVGAAAAVPEPSAITLVLLAGCGCRCLCFRSQRKSKLANL